MIGKADGKLKKKMRANIQFLILQMKTEKFQKNAQNLGMGLKMKLKQQMVVKKANKKI